MRDLTPTNEGVTITLSDGRKAGFLWDDVQQIETYKLDLWTTDTVCLNFQFGDKSCEVCEVDEGFMAVAAELCRRFPSVPQDWYSEVLFPAFAANQRILWPELCETLRTDPILEF